MNFRFGGTANGPLLPRGCLQIVFRDPVPLGRHLSDPVRMRGCQIAEFAAVFGDVIQFPWPATIGNQLPIAVAQGPVRIKQEMDRRARAGFLAGENGSQRNTGERAGIAARDRPRDFRA